MMEAKTDPVVRGILTDLSNKPEKGPFLDTSTDQLWFWQGKRRIDIKESLGLDLPSVYGPPNAKLVRETSTTSGNIQIWEIETEPQITRTLRINLGTAPTTQPTGFVLGIFPEENPKAMEEFENKITKEGLVALSITLRTTDKFNIDTLAEIYLNMGRCYAGVCATDIIRILDHIEHQFHIDNEPIILWSSGISTSIGFTVSAIDKRISATIVDYSDTTESLLTPLGKPPIYKDIYQHLGASPWLVVAQCCLPKPLVFIGTPQNRNITPLIENSNNVFLSFDNQMKILKATYKSAEVENKLIQILSSEQADIVEVLKTVAPLI